MRGDESIVSHSVEREMEPYTPRKKYVEGQSHEQHSNSKTGLSAYCSTGTQDFKSYTQLIGGKRKQTRNQRIKAIYNDPVKNTSRSLIREGHEVRALGTCRPANTMYSHLQNVNGQNSKVVETKYSNPVRQCKDKAAKAAALQRKDNWSRRHKKADFNAKSSVIA